MTEQNKIIRTNQVKQLYERLPIAAGTTYIVATLLIIGQWPVIDHSILLGWWGAIVVITSVRRWLVSRFRRAKPGREDIEPWAVRFFIGTLFSGLAWGAAAFFLFPGHEQGLVHQFIYIFVMAGMSSASVTTLAPVWADITAFLSLMLLPLILRFFLVGNKMYMAMGTMLILYLIGLILSARRMHHTNEEILTLRITEVRQGTKLLESEEKYRHVVERSNDGIGIIQDTLIKYTNKRLAEIVGYSFEEAENKPFTDYIHPEELPRVAEMYKKRMAGEDVPSTYETMLKHREGHTLYVELNVGIINYQGYPAEFVIIHDITQRKQAEEALRVSEQMFRNFVETSVDLVFRLSNTGYIQYVSPRVEELYGYNAAELTGKHLSLTTPIAEVPKAIDAINRIMTGESIKNFELNQKDRSGKMIPTEINACPVVKDGKIVGLQGIMRDITERKQRDEQIKASLREKEVLLKEIHHRVKNNLQTIVSLLNLQAGYIKDKQALEVFKNSQERVHAMALIHEKLYQSGDLSNIDFREYILSLVSNLFDSYSLIPGRVQEKIKVENVSLGIETAIPLGLIINELVSNSLKHAFPHKAKGELQVILEKSNQNEYDYILIIKDNGVGFPGGVDFRAAKSLGLILVSTLVKQLHGVIDLDREKGTAFNIKFKKLKYKKRI